MTFGKLPRKIDKLPIVPNMNLPTPRLIHTGPRLQEEVAETVNCSNWKVDNHIGDLTALQNQPTRLPVLFYGFWQAAKKVGKLPIVPDLPDLMYWRMFPIYS